MPECPHLVIDAHGMCEWCLHQAVVPDPRPQEISKPKHAEAQQPSIELLSARWAAAFGTDEDFLKAMDVFIASRRKL